MAIHEKRQAGNSGKQFVPYNFQCANRKLVELFRRWDNRLTIDNLSLAKRYIEGELLVFVAFILSGGGFNGQKCRAVFHRELRISRTPTVGSKALRDRPAHSSHLF